MISIRALFVFYSRSGQIRRTWIYKDRKCPEAAQHFYDPYTPLALVSLMTFGVVIVLGNVFINDLGKRLVFVFTNQTFTLCLSLTRCVRIEHTF